MQLKLAFGALAAVVSLSIPVVIANDLTFVIPFSPLLAHPSTLSPSTHAMLHASGAPLIAPITRKNTFEFHDIPPGSYLLTVHCRDFAFESGRVDVTAAAEAPGGKGDQIEVWQTFRGNEWDNRGEQRGNGLGSAVAEVRVIGVKAFYQDKNGFSPLAFLKSPMILMALFSLVVIVGLPYMMDNMDPSTRAEFEEMQKQGVLGSGGNPASQIQNFDLAGWMAGKSGAVETHSESAASQSQSSGGSSGSSKKRRK